METKEKKNIFESISLAMSEINGVGKNRTNELQKYNFRGIDDAMNVVNPVMVKYGLVIIPKYQLIATEIVTDKYGKSVTKVLLKGKFTFYNTDSESIEVETFGEAFDYSDKAFNKAMATALKYCLFQTFMIPTEEKKDTENDHIEVIEKPNIETIKIEPKKQYLEKSNKKDYDDYCKKIADCTTITQLNELYKKIGLDFDSLNLKEPFAKQKKFILEIAKEEAENETKKN